MNNRELKIATAPKRTSSRWTNTHTTPQDLTAKAYEPHIIPLTTTEYHNLPKPKKDHHKDIGGFVGGHLKNGQRRKGHILTRSLITLDIDNLPPTTQLPTVLNEKLNYAWLAHTTLSHQKEAPRWRLWIWLNRDITPDEYEAISRRIAQDINPGLNWFDPTTFEPERLMFWPSALTDSDYQAHISKNQPTLNPDTILARYDTWHDITTWPGITPTPTTTTNSGNNKVEDPTQKPGMLGAFNRAYPIEKAIATFLPTTYAKGTTKNRYTYTGGTSSNGLIIYNNGYLCYSQHATDPASDGHTHSAFDLIRIHKYGHLDTDANTPANKQPSYLAMSDFITQDPKTKEENAKTTAATINEAFQQITQETTAEDTTTHEDPTAWLQQLETKRNGDYTDTIGNFELIFTHDPRLNNINWNSLANQLQAQDPQALPWTQIKPGWTDNDDAQLKTTIARTYKGLYSPTKMHDALLSAASKRAFHPVRDYFNTLPPWDGIPRLDTLLVDTLGAEDTPYTHETTRKTLIAAVRRTFHPGTKFDTVLTLVGPQGIGKSTIFAKLAGQWFSDSLAITDMKDKTGAEKLAGNLIVEISELAGMRKTEAEPVKSFISRTEDKYRPAYGRTVEIYPRQCVIVGTTNATDGFLRDPTGGRRWWPINVTGKGTIKAHQLTEETIGQIWAEAIYYNKKGEPLYLTGETLKQAEHAQTENVETDDRTGLVAEYLEKKLPKSWDTIPLGARRIYLDGGTLPDHLHNYATGDPFMERASVSKIEIWAECFGEDPNRMTRRDSYDIASIMQQIDGWDDAGKSQRLPIYGKQRIYERTNVLVS